MVQLDALNEKQREAVVCTDSHIRIIAGAGSGKTRVITTRIAYLMEDLNVYPNRIVAITFTNKAANEMKERVESMMGDVAKAVRISTIHSFCVRLLREDSYILGYPRNFTVVDTDDQKSILKEAYEKYGVEVKSYSYASTLSFISNNKVAGVTPEEAREQGDFESNLIRSDVYEYYEQRLKEMLAMDFDDLLLKTKQVLEMDAGVRDKWQQRFDYIHVDEFQDVDATQYAIIKYITKEDSILCVVGDPDQTIYTWRGASVDIIMDFEKDFPNTKTVVLNQNYRSTKAILETANALIKHNQNRIDKDLYTDDTSETKVLHFSAADEQVEPLWVIEKIRSLHNQGVPYRDIGILYRSNYLSRGIEKNLLQAQMPYRIFGGLRFYDRKEIKDALCYLRLLAPKSEDDAGEFWKDLAIKRIINEPRRGIGKKTMHDLEVMGSLERINLYDVLQYHFVGKGKAKQAVAHFVEVIEKNKKRVEEDMLHVVLEKVLHEIGYMQMLEDAKEIERIENIKELLNDLRTYEEDNADASLQDYLQNVSLLMDNEKDEEVVDYIQLMSIHASKGLEFPVVFVFGVNEGIFPSERSLNEGGKQALEEERRLAYVAFTRAKERLFISDSNGYSYMLQKVKTPSRFIKELDDDYVEHSGTTTPKYRREDGFNLFQDGDHVMDMEEIKERKMDNGNLRVGDFVIHTMFDEGIILSLEEDVATIAFESQYGIRKINVNHPSIKRK